MDTKTKKIVRLVFCILLIFFVSALLAEEFKLQNGQIIKGRVVKQDPVSITVLDES